MQQKKWIWPATILAAIAVVVGSTIRSRDAGIQSERNANALLISAYEQKVKTADKELKALESQIIALNDLQVIANL